jgi:DNA-binding MarR family transcriptional regulator
MVNPDKSIDPGRLRAPGAAFLLSQLGEHSSRLWRSKLQELRAEPQDIVILRLIGATDGPSQRAIAKQMRLPPSRLVSVVDRLEAEGLLQRRRSDSDRRTNSLRLTAAGRRLLERAMRISRDHEVALTSALTVPQRKQLLRLLAAIASAEDLPAGVMVNQPKRPNRR